MCAPDEREVCLKDLVAANDCQRHNRASALFGDFQTTLFKGKHLAIGCGTAGAFREDPHRDTGLDLGDSCQNDFQTLTGIVSVEEQAADQLHPGRQQRNLFQFDLRNISADAGNQRVADDRIEDTAVISDVENCSVGRNVFLTDDSKLHAGQPHDRLKSKVDQRVRHAVFCLLPLPFSDQKFYKLHRNHADQKNHCKEQCYNSSNHTILHSGAFLATGRRKVVYTSFRLP